MSKYDSYERFEGRLFTEEEMEKGANSIIVIQNPLSGALQYKVGEILSITFDYFENEELKIVREFEIVGVIYPYQDQSSKMAMPSNTLSFKYPVDNAYIPYQTLCNLSQTMKNDAMNWINTHDDYSPGYGYKEKHGNLEFLRAYFKLNSIDDMESFITDLENNLSNFDYFTLQSDMANYYEVEGATNKLKDLALVVVYMAIFASIIIFSLVIYLYCKDRQYEVGLLLALGEAKKNILKMLAIEVLILGLLGVTSSFIFSKSVNNVVVNKLIYNYEEFEGYDQEQLEQLVSNESIYKYMMIALGVESIVILIACIYPLNKTLNTNPKNILT